MLQAAHAAITADGAVKAGPGSVAAVLLTAGDSAAATLVLYDNAAAASGTVLVSLKAAQGTSVAWTPAVAYVFASGCYADIGGSGAAVTVVYL